MFAGFGIWRHQQSCYLHRPPHHRLSSFSEYSVGRDSRLIQRLLHQRWTTTPYLFIHIKKSSQGILQSQQIHPAFFVSFSLRFFAKLHRLRRHKYLLRRTGHTWASSEQARHGRNSDRDWSWLGHRPIVGRWAGAHLLVFRHRMEAKGAGVLPSTLLERWNVCGSPGGACETWVIRLTVKAVQHPELV